MRGILAVPALLLLASTTCVLASFQSTAAFARVSYGPGDGGPVSLIRIGAANGSGHAVVDDLAFCAAQGAMGTPLADPIPEPIEAGALNVALTPVATGLTAPNFGTSPPGQPGQLLVTDQSGILWAIDLATKVKRVFLDVSARLVALGIGGPGSYDERGLLGVAFHPAYATNGLFYTYTSEPRAGAVDFSTMPAGQNANHQSVILEWRVLLPHDPSAVADPSSARELLRIDQPQFNHDGGCLAFGPDGMLYVTLGDGGAGDDQGTGHGAGGNGQEPANVLGSILRIDPFGSNSANGRYGIPADNPFVGIAGRADEIYAFGFRNPFRCSFDRLTGELYVGDVGQNDIEEVDRVTSGGNYGWNFMEGSFFFDANGSGGGFVTDVDPGVPAGLLPPLAEYDHDEGTAVIGGFVYRGQKIPALRGRYVFGDFRHGASGGGRLFYRSGDGVVRELSLVGQSRLGLPLLGFGEDAGGELYVLANDTGTPFGQSGVVLAMLPAPGATTTTTTSSTTTTTSSTTSTTTTTTTSSTTSTTVPPRLCGDASGDGRLTATDALAVLKAAVGAGSCALCLCDADGSGTIAATDALRVLMVAVGNPLSLLCPGCV